ncbi:hypothetical protein HRbin23_01219 [bacterium HR23]|nr:hypothetical protein HRbin23_01219 [bacterium HR23]
MATWKWWSKRRLLGILGALAPGPEGGCCVLCPAGYPLEHLHPPSAQALASLGEDASRAQQWPMGVVCFWAPDRQMWVLPPFPVESATLEERWDSPTFRALYTRPVRFGLLLLRRGGYALGVAEGEALTHHKVGSRYVQGRHRAGGSSARRFERRRREQVRHLLQEVCTEATARLVPHLPSLDALFLGGDRLLLTEMFRECPTLSPLKPLVHPHHLAVAEPRLEVLEVAVQMAWQSQVALAGPLTERAM